MVQMELPNTSPEQRLKHAVNQAKHVEKLKTAGKKRICFWVPEDQAVDIKAMVQRKLRRAT